MEMRPCREARCEWTLAGETAWRRPDFRNSRHSSEPRWQAVPAGTISRTCCRRRVGRSSERAARLPHSRISCFRFRFRGRARAFRRARRSFTWSRTRRCISARIVGCLPFELVNHAFPDPAAVNDGWRSPMERIRWSTASVVVAFPIFLFLSYRIASDLARDPV